MECEALHGQYLSLILPAAFSEDCLRFGFQLSRLGMLTCPHAPRR